MTKSERALVLLVIFLLGLCAPAAYAYTPLTTAGVSGPAFATQIDNRFNGTSTVAPQFDHYTVAALPTELDAQIVYASDGTPGTSPCSGGGGGAVAVGVAGSWTCLAAATIAYTQQTCSSTPCSITATFVRCDASGGARTLNLPAAVVNGAPHPHYITKIDSSGNACTVTATNSDLINGAGTFNLTSQYQEISVADDATVAHVWDITNTEYPVVPASRGGAGTVNGILKANGAGVVSAAVSATDYAPAPSGGANAPLFNNGSGGFTNGTRSGNTTSVATTSGTLTNGHNAGFDSNGNVVDNGVSITAPVSVANGGTQCGSAPTFAGLPGSPAQGTLCTVTDANSCVAGTAITSGGGSTKCQVVYLNTSWMPGGGATAAGSSSGTVNNAAINDVPYYVGPGTNNILAGAAINNALQLDSTSGPPAAFAGSGPLPAHQFATQISGAGVLSGAQPTVADISGSAYLSAVVTRAAITAYGGL